MTPTLWIWTMQNHRLKVVHQMRVRPGGQLGPPRVGTMLCGRRLPMGDIHTSEQPPPDIDYCKRCQERIDNMVIQNR